MTAALPVKRRRHIIMAFSLCVALATACFMAVAVHSNSLYDKQKEQPIPTAASPSVLPTNEDDADDANSTAEGFTLTEYMYLDMPKIGYQIFLKKLLEALRILNTFMQMDPVLLRITRTYLFSNETDDEPDPTNNKTNPDSFGIQDDQPLETNTESPLKNSQLETTAKLEDKNKENTHKEQEHEVKPNEKAEDKEKENIHKEQEHEVKPNEKAEDKEKENIHKEQEHEVKPNENPQKTEEATEKEDKPIIAVKETEPDKTEDKDKSKETSGGFFTSAANAVSSFFNYLTNWG